MRGAIITSIGQSNEELHLISKKISDYKYCEGLKKYEDARLMSRL